MSRIARSATAAGGAVASLTARYNLEEKIY